MMVTRDFNDKFIKINSFPYMLLNVYIGKQLDVIHEKLLIDFYGFVDEKAENTKPYISEIENNRPEIINPFPDIFKSINTYNCFIKYTKNHIIEPFIDYSYLFQRLLDVKLIHKVKHFEFMNWLFENMFIKENIFNKFKEENNFRTLKKSYSVQRENNFKIIFDV